MTALKRMYEVERAGGGLQLKTRAANVLEQNAEDRRQLFEDVACCLTRVRPSSILRICDRGTTQIRRDAELSWRLPFNQTEATNPKVRTIRYVALSD